MGHHRTYLHRGGGGSLPSSVPAPPLVCTAECNAGNPWAYWTWAGPDPDSWYIEANPAGAGWLEVIACAGNLRQHIDDLRACPGATSTLYRVVGLDPGGLPITDYAISEPVFADLIP